jgi:phosphoenolpyruvate---glycerone phosphotransferase subunit DhaM
VTVGLVIVSHSAKVAEGVVELAEQMAEEVLLVPAGGTDDGEIGTSAPKIADAIEAADAGDGVLVLVDLGSAVISARMAIDELIGDEHRGRVRISEGPLVEGAVIGAVQASTGSDLDAVERAAGQAATLPKARG